MIDRKQLSDEKSSDKRWGDFKEVGGYQVNASGIVFRDFYRQVGVGNIRKSRDANIISILNAILKFVKRIGWKDERIRQMEPNCDKEKTKPNSTSPKKKWLSPKTKYAGENYRKSKCNAFFKRPNM